jgi:hypothetical protein
MAEEVKKIRRYFTKQDYLDGLCDKHGKPLPGGPQDPPKRSRKDSEPTKAQQALNAHPATGQDQPAPPPIQPRGNASEGGSQTAVDPLTLDPPKAEEGFHSEIPEE